MDDVSILCRALASDISALQSIWGLVKVLVGFLYFGLVLAILVLFIVLFKKIKIKRRKTVTFAIFAVIDLSCMRNRASVSFFQMKTYTSVALRMRRDQKESLTLSLRHLASRN